MFTIFKKEIRSYLHRATALSFFIILSFAEMIFGIFKNIFGYYTVEMVLPTFSIVFALCIPVIIINIFARDRAIGTDKLLYSLPFKSSDIVLGKYFAILSVFGVLTALLAILPVIFGFFGTVNYLAAYLALVCFFLFSAAMLAMCMFISAAIKKRYLSVIISYASIVAAFLLYLVPTGASDNFWMTVAKTLRFLSPFSHLDNFSVGAVKINSVIYFVIFTLLFLLLAIRAEGKNRAVVNYGKGAPQIKCTALSPALAIILCVCAVVTNTALSFLPVRLSTIDVTANKSITLSASTKEFLSSLDCNVQIYEINADGSNRQFEYFVELYDEYSDKITVKNVFQDDIRERLVSLGWDGTSNIMSYTLLIESENGRSQVFHPRMAYYYSNPEFGEMSESQYGQYYDTLSQYAAAYPESYQEMFDSFVNDTKVYSNAEQQLTALIEYTTLDIIPSAYYLTGHGEPSPEKSNLYYFLNTVGFEFGGALDLSSANSLPEDASTVIINAPTSDLSNEEATLIKNFLAGGGSMTLITNEANLDMPNLMSLLSHYGVSAKKGYVSFDYEAAAKAEQEETETSDETTEETEYPDKNLVSANITSAHDSISSLYGYSADVLRANHIEISSVLRASVKVTPLLTTDKDCFIDGVEDSKGAKTVAVAIEETIDGRTTDIAWYTGAESFDGEGIQMLNAYAATYSVLWGIEEPEIQVGEISPKLISQNHPEVTGFTKYLLGSTPILVSSPLTYFLLKYKQDPFATKKSNKSPEENTEE